MHLQQMVLAQYMYLRHQYMRLYIRHAVDQILYMLLTKINNSCLYIIYKSDIKFVFPII